MNAAPHRHRSIARALFLGTLAAASPALPAATEEPAPEGRPETFGERVEVEVVDVDVVVTDRKGNRITGLTRDDFELRVDGRPVPIEYFAAPRGAAPPAESGTPLVTAEESAPAPPAAEAAAPSYLVVFVDQSTLRPKLRERAVAEIREYVRRMRSDERVAVAAFEQRLHLVAPPSADPAAIDAAFDELLRLPFTSSLVASERRFLDARIRSLMRESSFMPAQAVEEDARLLKLEIDRWADEELESQRRAIAGLRQLIGAIAALEGRKSVVVATRGATVDGDELLIKMLDAQLEALGVGGEMLQPNAGTFAHKQRVRDEFEAMVATAQDARVALYAVYPPSDVVAFGAAENASTGPNIAYMMPIDPAATDAAASVARMTGATGGASFLLGRNLDERLEAVRADADSVYSLGFTTGSEAGAGDHRIEVQVRGERLRVRHRESFRRRTPGELAERALYAAATLDEVRNPLGIELVVGEGSPVEEGHGDRFLAMAARVPLSELALLPDGDRRRGRLSFRVALLGERGDIFLSDSRTVPVDFAETDFEAAMAAAWVHRAEVRVKPSTRRLALLVVDEVAGVFATVTAAVAGGD